MPDGSGAGVGQQEAGEKRGSVLDVPATAENAHRLVLTHRIHGRRSRANVAIDLEWLDALAEEFNVECEVVDEDPGMNGNGEAAKHMGRGYYSVLTRSLFYF